MFRMLMKVRGYSLRVVAPSRKGGASWTTIPYRVFRRASRLPRTSLCRSPKQRLCQALQDRGNTGLGTAEPGEFDIGKGEINRVPDKGMVQKNRRVLEESSARFVAVTNPDKS